MVVLELYWSIIGVLNIITNNYLLEAIQGSTIAERLGRGRGMEGLGLRLGSGLGLKSG